MVTRTDTHFQRGFLMGMEAAARQESIMAPPWYREDANAEALAEFNQGVETAYKVFRGAR